MRKYYIFSLIAAIVFMAANLVQPAAASADTGNSRYFATTGHNVSGEFLKFFDEHGGLDIFGYPRTEQMVENGRTVQYFQRARMELWPENPAPYNVQLMLIGSAVFGPGEPPIPAPADHTTRYYPQTGHTVAKDFVNYFDANGGIDIFGYPIAEIRHENGLVVQYFQRARFELHDGGQVMLGLLGDEYIFDMGNIPASATAAVPPASVASTANLTSASSTAPSTAASSTGKIVFVKDNGGPIYSVNPDGSGQTQIATGMDPALSPDGQRLAYVSWNYPEGIHILDLKSGQDTLVYTVDKARAPSWSPDGNQLAFYVWKQGYRRARTGWTPDDFFNIAVLDLRTGKTWNPPNQPDHSFSPSWSPDGSKVIFKGDQGLYIGTPTSTTLLPNTNEEFAFPVWSPDGQHIAVMYRMNDHWDIGVINTDGSGLQLLTQSPPFTTPVNNVAPAWSTDGSKLVFVSDRGGTWEAYTMNADGSGQTNLSGEPLNYQWAMEKMVSWGK